MASERGTGSGTKATLLLVTAAIWGGIFLDLLYAGSAQAFPIITSDVRSITITGSAPVVSGPMPGTVGYSETKTHAQLGGTFSESLSDSLFVEVDPEFVPGWIVQMGSEASQTSSVTTTEIIASGSVSGFITSGVAMAEAFSRLSISFDLLESHSFSISADPTHCPISTLGCGAIFKGDTTIWFSDGSQSPASGILPPGSYNISAEASAGGSIGGLTPPFNGFSFTLALTLIPEPSTALLLGLGLVGLAARQRFAKTH